MSDLPAFAFDNLAETFDRRAGLPRAAVEAIAAALGELAGSGPGWVLDLGAGTGEIGLTLAAAAPDAYLGIDLAWPMLRQAQTHSLAQGIAARWVQADGNRPWPVAEGRLKLVFLSRAVHLLNAGHLIEEALRTAHPAGGMLVLGRVGRSEHSRRDALRRELRRLLAEEGVSGRRGEEGPRKISAALAERGGEPLPVQRVAHWPTLEIAAEALASWREKPGLTGVALPAAQRQRVLDRLEAWARDRYGDLTAPHQAEAHYELSAIRLPPR